MRTTRFAWLTRMLCAKAPEQANVFVSGFNIGAVVSALTCLAITISVAGWPPNGCKLCWVPKDSVMLKTGPFEIPPGGTIEFIIEDGEDGEPTIRAVKPEAKRQRDSET